MAKRETRVILALDVDSLEEAGRVIAMTRDHVSLYKVGSILFTAFGPGLLPGLWLLKRTGYRLRQIQEEAEAGA